jgi:hypothetical protein
VLRQGQPLRGPGKVLGRYLRRRALGVGEFRRGVREPCGRGMGRGERRCYCPVGRSRVSGNDSGNERAAVQGCGMMGGETGVPVNEAALRLCTSRQAPIRRQGFRQELPNILARMLIGSAGTEI